MNIHCYCAGVHLRGPEKHWRFPLDCDRVDCANAADWLCYGCFRRFCGTKERGHALDHYNESDHHLFINLNRKVYWCFKCETTQISPTEYSRVQIGFGMCMSPSSEDRESIGQLLRRFYRQGRPHPSRWEDLPSHRQQVFGGTASHVSLDRLLGMWKQGFIGNRVVVMVGAGVSVNAGIPDFRSPKTGLYAQNLCETYNLTRPEDLFTLAFFRSNPVPFFKFLSNLWSATDSRLQPTKTHAFLKTLQDKNKLLRVYTQNIDGLERKTGVERLIECHGSFSTASCIDCNSFVANIDEFREMISTGKFPIFCEFCKTGLVKPDITFFGEPLPDEFYRQSSPDFEECDLLIIIGTSLKVAPFNSLVSDVEDTVPRLLINLEPVTGTGFDPLCFGTPFSYRDIFIQSDCDAAIDDIMMRLGWSNERIDMEKRPRPHAIARPTSMAPSVQSSESNLKSVLPSLKKLTSSISELEMQRTRARMDLQVAIFSGDFEHLRIAIEAAKQCGLTYWELAASEEILLHSSCHYKPVISLLQYLVEKETSM